MPVRHHEEYIRDLAAGDPVLATLLRHALLRPLATDATIFSDPPSREVDAVCIHVRDWLKADLAEDAHWLTRLDRNGVPVKLAKLSSLRQANDEADKAMRRRLSRGTAVHADPSEGTTLEAVLDGGWSVVRLRTRESLDFESHAMQHCIGHGGYDDVLASGSSAFFSLRDTAGRPHVTLEVRTIDGVLVQIQGKQNELPVVHHARRIRPFVAERFVVANHQSEATRILVDAKGAKLDLDDLPDEVELADGDELARHQGRLPGRIVCRKRVHLPRDLPDGVLDCEIVAGSLEIGGGNLRRFARPIRLSGVLSVIGCPLEELHPETAVGSLHLVDLPNLVSLPGTIRAGSSVTIASVPLTRLPDSLRAVSSLALKDCPIVELPAGLAVNGFLNIVRCPVAAFPDDAVVRGRLRLEGVPAPRLPRLGDRLSSMVLIDCPIRELPEEIEVAYEAQIVSCPIERFPPGFLVEGKLLLENVPARDLPRSEHGFRELSLTDCGTKELPGDLHVRGGARIERCPIRTIPGTTSFKGGLTYVGDDLMLVEENSFGGDLSISTWRPDERRDAMGLRSDFLVVEAGTRVSGTLTLRDVKLVQGLPWRLRAGGLRIVDGLVGHGGGDIRIEGDVHVSCRDMDVLPGGFSCAGDFQHDRGWLGRMGPDTTIEGDFSVRNSCMTELPANLTICGRVVHPITSVGRIGSGFSVGTLDAAHLACDAVLPDDARIGTLLSPKLLEGRIPVGAVVGPAEDELPSYG